MNMCECTWICVNGSFLPPLPFLFTLLCLGPPLEGLIFCFAPHFALFPVVAVRNHPLPLISGNSSHQNISALPSFPWAVPWYFAQCRESYPYSYMLCSLYALSQTFQGTLLEMLLHICLCMPRTSGTHQISSAFQLIIWPACSVPAQLTTACHRDEERCLWSASCASLSSVSVLTWGSEILMAFLMTGRTITELLKIKIWKFLYWS